MREPLSKLSRLGMYLACYTVPLQLTPNYLYTQLWKYIYIHLVLTSSA